MKQCAGCGRHYAMAQMNCPRCYARAWVAEGTGDGSLVLPAYPTPCSECGYLAAGGTARCPHCRASLRPKALTLLCLLACVGCLVAIIYLALALPRNLWGLIDIALAVVVFIVAFGLLHGRFLAWKAMRLVLVAGVAIPLLLIVAFSIRGDAQFVADQAGILLLRFIGAALLWVVLHTDAVRDYCAIGKPVEVHEIANSLFLEAAYRPDMTQLDRTITREL